VGGADHAEVRVLKDVLFVDDALIVVDKPAGLLAVPGRGDGKADCMAARTAAFWPVALIVHRLDMATSGLVVMARSLDVQRALSAAFADRQVHNKISPRLGKFIATAGPATVAAAAQWHTPTLLMYAGADKLVNPAGSRAFAENAANSPAVRQDRPSNRRRVGALLAGRDRERRRHGLIQGVGRGVEPW
jgi:pimeloyl-ACP methyl ester carboxylesterase